MSLDAVAAISSRLTQIRSLVDGVSPGTTGTLASSYAAAGGSDFESALAAALGETTSSSAGPSSLLSGSSSGLDGLLSGSTAGGVLGLGGLGGLGSLLTTSTTAGTAAASSSAALNADGVPADLAAYGNGHIPEAALAPVEGSAERLWAPAAAALDRLIDAAAADGVTIGVTDGYRSYEAQAELVQEKGLYSAGGLAAAPGTSEHGWGMAADLALDSSALAWMREHAGEYGFAETTPRESWHWSYHPA